MGEYRGPTDSSGIEQYILEDCKPSVTFISKVSDIKNLLQKETKTVILGFFNPDDVIEDEGLETFSITAWGQFQATADIMRG